MHVFFGKATTYLYKFGLSTQSKEINTRVTIMKLAKQLSELDFLSFTAKEFQVEQNVLSLQTEFRSLPNWSSLNALIFISAINDTYGALISSTDLSKSNTLGDLFAMIKNSN